MNIVCGKNENSNEGYFSRIRARYDFIPKSQRKIANYISEHCNEILKYSITMLSQKIGTSPSAISRFCQNLHYRGFSDMRFCLEKDLFSPFSNTELITEKDDILATKRKFLNFYSSALKDTLFQLDARYLKWAVEAICSANMVHIYANGGPGDTASFTYHLFLQIGIPCNYFVDRQEAIMSAPYLKKGDVAVGITYSGDATIVLDTFTLAQNTKATLIGITARANSPLAKLASILLCYSARVEDDLRYLHVARMCELAIIGQLQSAIINKMPQKVQEHIQFSKRAIEMTRKK
jgi:DNA-binding MurR/RpiR family transcriptional regulator